MASLTYEEIGRRLSHARRHAGFTQRQVAEYLGINREQLSYVETGRRPVDLPTMQRLADLYGFALSYFVASELEPSREAAVAAFRSDSIAPEDLEVIRWVKRFAMNLDSLKRFSAGEGGDEH